MEFIFFLVVADGFCHGKKNKQSNARLVRWSDGTLGLFIGKFYYDVTENAAGHLVFFFFFFFFVKRRTVVLNKWICAAFGRLGEECHCQRAPERRTSTIITLKKVNLLLLPFFLSGGAHNSGKCRGRLRTHAEPAGFQGCWRERKIDQECL